MTSDRDPARSIVDPLMRSVLNGSDRGLCILDETGAVVAMNPAAEHLLGRRESELLGTRLLPDLVAASGQPQAAAAPPDRGVARWPRPDETPTIIRWRVERLSFSHSHLDLLYLEPPAPEWPEGASCDIDANFRAILDTITDGVIVIDEMGTIEVLNPAAERMFGYSRDEAIGRNVKMLMPSPEREHHDEYLAHYRETGERKIIGIGREVAGRRKDGRVFPLYLSIGELVQGRRRLFVGITRDLTARKEAEDRLMILSRAVDQSPVGIMITDLEGRIEYVNRGYTRLTGYSPEDVVGLAARALEREAPTVRCLLRAGEQWHGEICDVRKSGETYWALQTLTPVRDGSGRVTRYLAMQQDITQQKRDREALAQSEERFRHIADTVGEWLWEQDAEGRYLYCSAAVEQILGYRPEEVVGRSYQDFLTEENRRFWVGALPSPSEVTHRFRKLTNCYRHRDGHEVYTESTGAPILDDSGKVVRWRGMDLDITARKQFEDALRVRDRAIEAANVGIAIADAREPNFPVVYANPALCRITGYSREELMNRSLRVLQGPDTDPADREKIRTALRVGGPCEVVIKNYKKNGTAFWNELLLSPVRDQKGVLTHYIGIQTDITERRRAEEERRELEIARQIQMSLLPKVPLKMPELEVAGICVPATHVGGDYFDFFTHGNNVDMVVADVSGHSVGAALIMAEMRSTLKAEIRRNRLNPPPTSEIVGALNEVLFSDLNSSELFITMFYVRYGLETRRLDYTNAGHNQALLLSRGEPGCSQLDAEGLILGVKPKVRFEERSGTLMPGDSLLLYTDGVTEAQNEAGEFFGLYRLCRAFQTHRDKPPEQLLQMILADLHQFRGKHELQDDISMVALRVR